MYEYIPVVILSMVVVFLKHTCTGIGNSVYEIAIFLNISFLSEIEFRLFNYKCKVKALFASNNGQQSILP